MSKQFRVLAAVVVVLATTALSSAQNAKAVFNQLDKDKDGFVQLQDVPRKLRDRIADLDINEDGQISSKEMKKLRGLDDRKNRINKRGSEPTFADVAYSGNFDRSKMDVWLPETANGATPIVVYFHGGSFRKGDKNRVRKGELIGLPQRGIALASVNYPLEAHIDADEPWGHLPIIFDETRKAIAYIRANAVQWGIDPDRIVLAGSSAGAVMSKYLAYAKKEDVEAVLALQTPYPVDLVINEITFGSPELFLFTRSGSNDRTHHPRYAQDLYDQCLKVGMDCHLYGSEISGLPQLKEGETILDVVAQQLDW